MEVLICLFAALAVANAGILTSSGVYGSGVISTGNIISAPITTTYVQSAPAPVVQTVHVVKQPVYHSVASSILPAQIYQTAPIYHHTSVVSAPVISTPVVSTSYGINSGLRYASTYGIGHTKIVSGILKHK